MTGSFVSVRVVGGVLPADLLSRVVAARDLPGLASGDFHLAAGESVREAANRKWAYLTGAWRSFRGALDALPEADRATSLTRERWLLLLLRELDYGRVPLTPAGGPVADGDAFAVSHVWQAVPVHLLGWRVELDARTKGVAGAAGASPQSLVQELLNRDPGRLWGVLSNGRVLRLLRDSTSLVDPSYVEFDLEAMFDGELFADFLLMFSLLHQSRLEVPDGQALQQCWLERWRLESVESGSRALNLRRDGVVQALQTMGTGLLQHPHNTQLREDLQAGRMTVEDYRQALLRAVYRLLFVFVAEDRQALLDPQATPAARETYERYFATARLRRLSQRRRGSRHSDLWAALCLVFAGLGSKHGRPEIGLVGLGGLFEPYGPAGPEVAAGRPGDPVDLLGGLELTNEALLSAVRSLSTVPEKGSGKIRAVDYRNLGAEELGSIYESLLEYVPRYDPGARTFALDLLSGNERKTTGSYYTPRSLIEVLLDSALDPVLDEAQQADDPREGLLSVTVCDPACGSGHFLVAAARRIAKRVAALDTGDPEPSPDVVRAVLRDVVSRCIYGVDLNPLAADLAKVSLWLESLQPGLPLAFLDAHIKVGNALLGATPALVAAGLPDAAFKPIEGDDRAMTAALVKRNRDEVRHRRQHELDIDGTSTGNDELGEAVKALASGSRSYAEVQAVAKTYRALQDSPELQGPRLVADAWCAAFVWRKLLQGDDTAAEDRAPRPISTRDVDVLAQDPTLVDAEVRREVAQLAAAHQFFHWHLEFPEIFSVPSDKSTGRVDLGTGGSGGFSCVLGNPPWEHSELKEQEFFAVRDPDIAAAPGAARKRRIAALEHEAPELWRAYQDAKRVRDAVAHIARASGRYPLCGRGRINTYASFAETSRLILDGKGRMGMILPTGIATDSTTQHFFRDLVESATLSTLYDFENAQPLFVGVHRSFKFCLLTLTGSSLLEQAADFAFFVHDPADLDRPDVRFALKPDEITLLNPNTGTSPIFRSRRDAEITLGVYRRLPVLLRHGAKDGNLWDVSFMQGLFNMTSDSRLFRTRQQMREQGLTLRRNEFVNDEERWLPLYEAKMMHHYDHRWATYNQDGVAVDLSVGHKLDPELAVLPRYWVHERTVAEATKDRWSRDWFLGWRDITNTTNERTTIAGMLPRAAVGNNMPLILSPQTTNQLACLAASLCSLAQDYCARIKAGGVHLNYFILEQLPVLPPHIYEQAVPWQPDRLLEDWIVDRVEELVYTAWDMAPFALDLHDDGPPFVWDEERRALMRTELDAAYFHLYGLERDEVEHVLGTFLIVKRKDEAKYGEFRTRRLVLEMYDEMAKAMASGPPYQTRLDPPPSNGPRHPERAEANE